MTPSVKRWPGIAIVAVVAAGAGLSCEKKAEPPAPAPAPAAAPAPAVPRVRGVTDNEILLGMVASFTGSNKERGRSMRTGWEAALNAANEAGGVNGRKLRLLALDDGYDPARTLAPMKDLVETQGVFAIVGNVGTSTSAVAAPYCMEKKVVFYGALSGGDGLRKTPPDRYVFNFRASLRREGEAAVKYLVQVRRVKPRRIAALVQQDDFGESGWRGVARQLVAYGVKESDILKLGYPRNTADVSGALARLKKRARAYDALIMVATYKPAATMVRRGKDAGLKLFYISVSADSNGMAEDLVQSGRRYTHGVGITQVVPVPTSQATAIIKYRQALEKQAPGEKPGSTTLEAWIGAQIFLEGLKRAGRDLDTEALVAALEGIRDWDIGIGAPISFGPADHQGSEKVWGWLLQQDGTFKQIDLE